jgi:hypothetical protein
MARPAALLAVVASLSLVVPATAASGDEGHGHGNSSSGHSQQGDSGNRGGDGHGNSGQSHGNGNGNGNGNGESHGNSGQGHGNSGESHGNSNDAKQQSASRQASPAPAPAPTPAPDPAPAAAAAAPTSSPSAPPVAPVPQAPAAATPKATRKNPRARAGNRTTPGRQNRGTTSAARGARPATRTAGTPAAPLLRPATRDPQPQPAAKKPARKHQTQPDNPPTVIRTFRTVVQHIPGFVKAVIVVLAFLLLASALAWGVLARTARFLRRQRAHLLGEIGVLQGALLPNVPSELSRLEASVAYKPAEGLAAGGDFYDAFALDDGRVGIVVGDVAGHGREALMHTALLRYTLRAYLEADLEPRVALQVAGRALDRGFDTLATVVLAVYDPGRHVLRYASAGHPSPVFLGDADHVPVTRASSPPIGAGLATGVRQTTVSLPSGSAVCFFTDGLIEARRDGALIGRLGLVDIIRELGPHATATQLLERVSQEADVVSDDMAACMFRVSDGPNEAYLPRVEEIEVVRGENLNATLAPFLEACGVDAGTVAETTTRAQRTVRQFRGAIVRVSLPSGGPRIEVRPANVESLAGLEARRAATG